ncbi:MAG: 2-oxo acid dehydrogenase subunit E2 [Candidatus Tectomicrobia bacterium]|nr:2-oxo acid dehydrogenase subunit E2 [Candidatus Tectomicrobia bacterium]
MEREIVVPQMGYSIIEVEVIRWLCQPGEKVTQGEPLVEIETEKATLEIESPYSGLLTRILKSSGTAQVGEPIALIEVAADASIPFPSIAPPLEKPTPLLAFSPKAKEAESVQFLRQEGVRGSRPSPLVQRIAREHRINLDEVRGTGPDGRITKEDIGTFVKTREKAVEGEPSEVELIPLTPIRKRIAANMVRSIATIPHAGAGVEVNMKRVVDLREAHKEAFQKNHGVPLTYLPFVITAVVAGIKAFPSLNASFRDDQIALYKHVNLGIAVATTEGLKVPVISFVETLTFPEVAQAIHRQIEKAREGTLALEDLTGGTFTINNPGVLGSVRQQQIIVPGQAAILGIGKIVRRVVVLDDDTIGIRPMMNLDLSFDHRIMDGYEAVGFLEKVREQIEQFESMA